MQHIELTLAPHGTALYYPKGVQSRVRDIRVETSDGEHSVIFLDTPYSGGTHQERPTSNQLTDSVLNDIDSYTLVGDCVVVDVSDVPDIITPEHLADYDLTRVHRLLFRTAYSTNDPQTFVQLAPATVAALRENNISFFGIDAPTPTEKEHIANLRHRSLVQQDVTVCEGLQMDQVKPGTYFMTVVPKHTEYISGKQNCVPAQVHLYTMS